MPRIFHQNLRVFGGGRAARNAAFQAALAEVQAAAGVGYLAAGFTETMNDGDPCQGALRGLANSLDEGLGRLSVIAVGTTAVGVQTEFVGIAWNPDTIDIEVVGQVLLVDREWQVFLSNQPGEAVPATVGPPPGIPLRTADSRGLAFAAGMVGGLPCLIGFMHNMLNLGDKTGAYDNIPAMATRACQAIGGAYTNAHIIVGGDFNLPPRNPGTARTRGQFYCVAATDGNGAYVRTTVANAYDYWLVNFDGLTSANVGAHFATRGDGGRSDHAGISLNF